jgi:enoyl-CoA hydratase/carnithine racemase
MSTCKVSSGFSVPRRLFALRSKSSTAAAFRKRAIYKSGAPTSIALIKDEGFDTANTPAFIRQVGCTRRVFLLQPYMSSAELEGLAYRIKTLTKNDGINSVLIATDNTDDIANGAMPSILVDRDHPYIRDESVDEGFAPAPGQTFHVAGGYDPLELYKQGKHKDAEYVAILLQNLAALASAVMGDSHRTKVPTICIPHGIITDGGFAFLLASYVMTTRESCFRILNPSKGLSLDPVGLSYFLPRLGMEFRQPAAQYSGCGMIVGLMGFEADHSDMLETGLATNYMETPVALGLLEHTLSEIPPWSQQGLLKNPVRYHSDPVPSIDHNGAFRNVAVADAIHCCSSGRADGSDMWTYTEPTFEDPSLETDPVPWHEYRVSDLVNYAATFDGIFKNNSELTGILESLREVAGRHTNDPEEQEGIDVAADFVARLERQSPLAVSVVHRMLRMGASSHETLRSCLAREHRVQKNMFGREDFEHWAAHAVNDKIGGEPFTNWKHKCIADVKHDEVTEIIEAE